MRLKGENMTNKVKIEAEIIKTVTFQETEIQTFEYEDILYCPAKPLAENIGLKWPNQKYYIYTKFRKDFECKLVWMPHKAICIPVSNIQKWFDMIVDLKKVDPPEAQKVIEIYQKDFIPMLKNYWGLKSELVRPKNVVGFIEKKEVKMFRFRGSKISTFRYEGKPYCQLRFLTESMGLGWSQVRRNSLKLIDEFDCRRFVLVGRHKRYVSFGIPAHQISNWIEFAMASKTLDSEMEAKAVYYQTNLPKVISKFWKKIEQKEASVSVVLDKENEVVTVDFHNTVVDTFRYNEIIYCALRPIVEDFGLSWSGQRPKIQNKAEYNAIKLPSKGRDHKIYTMICLPIEELKKWLFSVNSLRVNEKAKDKIQSYQEEFFTILDDSWHKMQLEEKMEEEIISIDFNGDKLQTLEHEGVAYCVLRPVVENLGLSWHTQRNKIQKKYKFKVVRMNSFGKDNKNRSMLCIPVSKINGWLFSINPEKVRKDLKPALEFYQEECFKVLHDYWNNKKEASEKEQLPVPASHQANVLPNTNDQNSLLAFDQMAMQAKQQMQIIDILKQHHLNQEKQQTQIVRLERHTELIMGYRTIRGYCNIEKIKKDKAVFQALEKIAARICRKEDITVDRIPDKMYGEINSYPVAVIRRAVEEYEKTKTLPRNVLVFPDKKEEVDSQTQS